MKRILILIFSNLGVKIVTILYGVLGARLLGPELKGIYALVLLLPSLYVSFFDFGIGQASVYFFKKKDLDVKQSFSSLVAFTAFLSVIVPIALLLLQPALRLLFPLIKDTWIFYLSIFIYPFLLFQTYASVFVLAINYVKRYSIIWFCKELVSLLLISILYVLHVKSIGLMLAVYMSTNIASCLILYFTINSKVGFRKKDVSVSIVKKLVSYGYKFNILSILQWIYYKVNFIIVGIFIMDPAQLGIFSVASSFADLMFIISSSAMSILFIDEATVKDEKCFAAKFDKVRLNIKMLMLLMVAVGIMTVLFGYPAILVMYSRAYINAYYPLVILVPGNIVFSIYKLYGSLIAASGKPEKLIGISFIAMVGSIILNILAVPRYGIIGAAFATSISYTIAAIITVVIYKRLKKCTVKEMLLLNRDEFAYVKSKILKHWRFGR
jgi:O-antigen/teichoic acid export membrane protein